MNHEQIERIVQEVFEKAKKGSVSHSKYALAKQVVKEISVLNPKTLERAYSRYIEKNDATSIPSPETIRFFCTYIGYQDYEDYISKNPENKIINIDKGISKKEKNSSVKIKRKPKKKYTWSLTLKIVIAFGAIMIIVSYYLKDKIYLMASPYKEQRCMVWKNDHYEEVVCDITLMQDLQEYDPKIINNFKKIDVNANTQFFFENGLPRVWYFKKPNGEIDYFSANGNHPIYKRDVKEISQHIINKYVLKSPFNTSFLNTPDKVELAIFIFHNDTLDLEIAKQLQKTLFSNYRTTLYLIPAKKINPQIKEHLKQGDLSTYKSDMKKHIDYLCVGNVSYNYEETAMESKRFICNMQLSYEVFDTQGNLELDKSYSKSITGSGFTKEEARQNTLKKIAL